jgi:citrate lyase subunit beta/citryl-CoA lyase
LLKAQAVQWGPIQHEGNLHDRASYRYYWSILQRAHATGIALPPETAPWFARGDALSTTQ